MRHDLLPGPAPRRGADLPRRHPHQRRRRQRRHLPQAARAATRAATGSSCSSRPATWRPPRRCSTASTATSTTPGDHESLATVDHLFEAALYVGRLEPRGRGRAPRRRCSGSAPTAPRRSSSAARSAASAPDILLVYPEGNYIRASDDRPFLQIGESKYGKFMLELAVAARRSTWTTATKIALELDDQHGPRQPVGRPALRPRHLAGRRRRHAPGVPGDGGLAAAGAAARRSGSATSCGPSPSCRPSPPATSKRSSPPTEKLPSALNVGARRGE